MELSKENLKKYYNPENFFNRDLSWVEFNRRVLEEALNPDLPLLERVKFISIFFSNLDEFYMIRVSGLKEQIAAKIIAPTIDGLTPIEQVKEIERKVKSMLNELYDYWNKTVENELRENNIVLAGMDELNDEEQRYLDDYFSKEIYPVLTPLAFDPGRPFPYISNLSLSFAILVQKPSGDKHFARVKIPSILPRLLRIDELIPTNNKTANSYGAKFIWIEDLIEHNLHKLFPGLDVIQAHRFRITRDTDIEIQEDEADDLLQVIEENIRQKRFGLVIRLEVEKDMPEFMIETLTENLQITAKDTHIIEGPLGLSSIMQIYDLPFHHLKQKPFHPVNNVVFEEEDSIFNVIRQKDILLHHPYDSFNPVINFIKEATEDPDVLAIKQTLYRIGQNSPIVKYLIDAAQRKKQVAVLVELKARFDEENNIYWARELEKAGIHVVYGLVGLKTHSKMSLIVRKENDRVKRYVHLGTGNYNPNTAKLYTDVGIFTSNEEICADVSEIFNYLTGYSEQKQFRKLMVAPINIREHFLELIGREIDNVKNGGKGHLLFKMNSLVDPILIASLYEASNQGVKIDLIVRGICCLVPQKNGVSDNITVRSIVGRFLEHSRLFYFYNNGNEEIYSGSADLMPRNLDRRVETIFPIEDKEIKKHIIENVLKVSLEDKTKARLLMPSGKYVFNRPLRGERRVDSQEWLMDHVTNAYPKLLNQEVIG